MWVNDGWFPNLVFCYLKKWVPTIKDQWLRFVTQIGPHVKSLTAKSVEVYHASKNTIEPHVVKVQEMVDPYLQVYLTEISCSTNMIFWMTFLQWHNFIWWQEGKKFTKPYIDQVATVTSPHVDKARVFLKPYTKKVTRTYRKFVKAGTMYHRRVFLPFTPFSLYSWYIQYNTITAFFSKIWRSFSWFWDYFINLCSEMRHN